jgi:hypothetical protein
VASAAIIPQALTWDTLAGWLQAPFFNIAASVSFLGTVLVSFYPGLGNSSIVTSDPQLVVYFWLIYPMLVAIIFAKILHSVRCPFIVRQNVSFQNYLIWTNQSVDALRTLYDAEAEADIFMAHQRMDQVKQSDRDINKIRATAFRQERMRERLYAALRRLLIVELGGTDGDIGQKWRMACEEKPHTRLLISALIAYSAICFAVTLLVAVPDIFHNSPLAAGLIDSLRDAPLKAL